ncbi:FUSC family protein [Legionella nagasakiensis]|uniref:FUSC family protein n=1 Tax=Legionella nagasakiensis TaxID=535290 RepID=UPI0010551B92|nr:FUSC family protein [Legionella nagasakiensis]
MKIIRIFFEKYDGLFPATVLTLSAIICFCCYRYFKWSEGYWAVITVAAVTQDKVHNTIIKVILRSSGTIIGAGIGYLFVIALPKILFFPIFFLGMFLAVLLTLAATKYRYMMIIAGLTFSLVAAAGITDHVVEIAIERTYEVIFGCLVCFIVSLLLQRLAPHMKGEKQAMSLSFIFHHGMIIEAVLMSAACALTFFTWQWFKYPLGFWATITCLFVLEENLGHTIKNAWKRIKAHIVITAFASIVALFITAENNLILLPLAIGLFICGYYLGQNTWLSPMANTMGVALSVVLLVEVPNLTQFEVVLARFLNVMYGSSVAFIIMYIGSQCNRYQAK